MEALKECKNVTSDHIFKIMLLERIEKLEDMIWNAPNYHNAHNASDVKLAIALVNELKNTMSLLQNDIQHIEYKLNIMAQTINTLDHEVRTFQYTNNDVPAFLKYMAIGAFMLGVVAIFVEFYKIVKN